MMKSLLTRHRSIGRCLSRLAAWACLSQFAAHADQVIYDDALENGWQNWSWATVNLANTSPVHSGADSISVIAYNSSSDWEALYLSLASGTLMDTTGYTNLVFWINGGAAGGQQAQVQGILQSGPQPPVQIGPLPTNSWKQVVLSLSALGVADQPNFTGFWLQGEGSSTVPTFYVDDITLQSAPPPQPGTNAGVTVQVDAASSRHPISPLIYGVAYAPSSNALQDLNAPLHRSGGNATTRYNWQLNATSHAADWYFESLAESSSAPGGDGDEFIQESKAGGAQAMLTIPIIGWVAKLGANRAGLASYSVAKYGAQTATDPYWSDAGNGVSQTNGLNITNNIPTDANMTADTNFQAGWVQHLTNLWGTATNGGLRYYLMDNEWSIWFSTHRDVHPIGPTMDEVLGKFCAYAAMVKGIDPNALVAGPEEWGWSGYFESGYDQQTGGTTDRAAHGGQDFAPWFLSQVRQNSQAAGKRLIDIFSLHYYPQGGEPLNDNVSMSMQLLRNRSTRSLWDTNYTDQSWINSIVMLIPRMKQWVATNYPGTLIGITEYNWGADDYMNGATVQADILGIFGREGLDLGTRWTCPNSDTPAYYAFKMYRNYDGNLSTFGDINVSAVAPDPDDLAAFAAVRSSDGSLTVMVINKDPLNATPLTLSLTNLPAAGTAQVWQLATTNGISQLPGVSFTNGILNQMLPAQSITLFVLPSLLPFHLQAASVPKSGQWSLSLNGQSERSYGLQSSTDLVHWVVLNTNTLTSNSFPFSVATTNATSMFYRAWLISP